MNNKLGLIALLVGVLTFGGCATVFDGSNQEIVVSTLNDKAPEKTQCRMVNEEGEWRVVANTKAVVHRDGNAMSIECENEFQKGIGSASPRFQAEWLLLDLVWDACILTASCIIDGATNAFYEYPSSVPVNMADKVAADE